MADTTDTQTHWETSFDEQIALQAYNTAPVEALVRTVSYYLRSRRETGHQRPLHFLEMGCGAGPNLLWLAQKGIRVSGIDISPTALGLAGRLLERAGVHDRLGALALASVADVPFRSGGFDGIVEACVFQHLGRADRAKAFSEVARLLRPGGVFVGYMLDAGHTIYQQRKQWELADDPGTLILADGRSRIHLTDLGLSHFYNAAEIRDLLKGFSTVDPCLMTYYIPRDEARRRGCDEYLQSMWTVYAIR